MNDIILDNDCYLKIITKDNIDAINIEEIKLKEIFNKKDFLIKIDFKSIKKEDYKKILKRLLFVKNHKRKIGIEKENKKLIGYVLNYENNSDQNDFISAINAIYYNTKYERYNYIYDTVCDYLDSCFYGKNLCDFKNNKCGEKINTSSTIGCCRHTKCKWLPLGKFIPCEYLNKQTHKCDAKCLGCKLFTCDYLVNKGVKFRMKDILLLDVFLIGHKSALLKL